MSDWKQTFHEQGYVIFKNLISPDIVQRITAGMEQWVEQIAAARQAAGLVGPEQASLPFDKRLYALYQERMADAPKSLRKELHMACMYDLFFNPELLDYVEELLGNEIRLYPNYTVRPKFPDWEGTLVLWHQDGGYTEFGDSAQGEKIEGLDMVNVWSPLVSAHRANGCMQFIPGTHKLGVVRHESREHYLQIAQDILDPLLAQAVDIELEPGDVVLFHNLLFHQGLPNETDSIRWSVDWRYQNALQPTYRKEQGHLARSKTRQELVVNSGEMWSQLTFS